MLSFTHAGNGLTSMQGWDGANLPQLGTFTYGAMGNQLTDSRKGLQFCYNLANLPSKVEGSAGSGNAGLTLSYGYLSDGTKTSSIAGIGSSAEGLKYRGSFVYELKEGAERLSSVGWSEGRTEYVYAPSLVEDGDEVLEGPEELLEIDDLWYVPDHLGNVRAVVLMDYSGGTVLEQNEYLPFGTRLSNPSFEQYSNRYRLGGKEEQRFGALDLALSDFGARFYDPFTARWTTRDPLAGKYHSLSPYNYCAGNPVNLVDPDGMADKKWLLGGVGLVGKGIVETASGGALALSGVGAGAAAFLISDGIASIGLGLGMATAGVTAEDNSSLEDKAYDLIKDGPVGLITKSLDMATDTEVPVFEIAGGVIESAIGISTFKVPSNALDIISDGLTIKQTIETTQSIYDAFTTPTESLNSDTVNTAAKNLEEWNTRLIEIGLWTQLE